MELCTVKEACNLTKVSRRTIYNWMAGNKIKFIRTPSGRRRIYVDSLYIDGNIEVKFKC